MVTTSPSKAARLWKRTWVGGLLAGVLALLLAWSFRDSGAWVVYVAGVAIGVAGALELARMGRFAERELGAPILVALFAQLVARWPAVAPPADSLGGTLLELARPAVLGVATLGALDLLAARLPRDAARLCASLALAALALATRAGTEPGTGLLFWGACGLPCAFAVGRALDERRSLGRIALVAAVCPWIAFAPPAWTDLWWRFGASGLLALVVLSKLGDVFGYYVGSAIGRRRPFPKTSPGKTVAGCVASLVAGTVCGGVFAATGLLPREPLGLAGGLAAGALVNLAAQTGDLAESKAKRWAGVKDSGRWFGPSGGVLDLVDSLLVSVPVALLTWPALFPLA